MRRIFLLSLVILASSTIIKAQSFGYINTETILKAVPEYATAQQQIQRVKAQYDAEIEGELKKVEQLYNTYQAQKANLSQSERSLRENEIITKERAVKELQKKYFGQEGVMAAKSKEIMEPIMTKLKSAIEKVAQTEGFIIIFDIATAQGVVYNNPANDMSQKVIKLLN
ncbi:Outer Membrane Chaperone Skp [Bacteroidales bacterium CF]|jgi:outer membrane protein|nr:Outer Membrane Chaperone Skp [Bacteroidales bacterium CF]